jgi:uncharacterized delta-60 repeat protein
MRAGLAVVALILASCGSGGSTTSSTSTSGAVRTTSATTTTAAATTTTALALSPGTLDPSFGTNGLTTVSPALSGSAVPALAAAVAIDTDGRIVAAGEADVAEQRHVAIARLFPNGSPDEAFGERGSLVFDRPGDANGLLLLDDGRMVITGTSTDSGDGRAQLLLAGFLEDGSPDVTFGTDGRATLGCDLGHCSPVPPVRQSGGRIVIVATDITNEQPFEGTIAVYGFDRNGQLDPSFGIGGVTQLGSGAAGAVALDASQRVVIVGATSDRKFVTRLSPNGTLDLSFGANGISTFPLAEATDLWNAVTIDGDRIVVAGGRGESDDSDELTLTRLDGRGRLDTSYGTAGTVGIPLTAMSYPAAVVADELGRATVAGVSDGQFVVIRVDQAGRLDTTFGSRGITLISFGGPGPDGASSMVADANGQLVVGGYAFGMTYTFALVRLTS